MRLLLCFLMGGLLSFDGYANRPESSHKLAKIPHFDQKIKSSDVAQVRIKVEDIKTPKGQLVWMVKTTEIPVVTVDIVFRHAGSKNEPKGKLGVTSLLTGLLTKGAGDLPSQAFQGKLLEYNIQLGFIVDKDNLTLSFRTVKENVGKAFELIKLMLTKPLFEPSLFEHERKSMIQDLTQMKELYNVKIKHAFGKMIFGDHPYHQDLDQSLKDAEALKPDDLRKHMKDRMGQDQIIVSAVGDIDEKEFLKALDDALSTLSLKAQPNTVKQAPFNNKGKVLSIPFDIPQSMILFAQPGLRLKDPDYYPMVIVNMVLGELGVVASRLMRTIREEKGLAYDISSGMSLDDHSTIIGGGAGTLKPQEVIEETIRIIQEVREHGITEDELEFAKRLALQSYALQFNSTGAICSILTTYQVDGRDKDYINHRNDKIAEITMDQIKKAAQRLNPAEMAFAVIGEVKKIDSEKIEALLKDASSSKTEA